MYVIKKAGTFQGSFQQFKDYFACAKDPEEGIMIEKEHSLSEI